MPETQTDGYGTIREHFKKNIAHVDLECTSNIQLDKLVTQYSKAVGTSLDTHAPLTKVTLKGDKHKPWYDDDIHEQRRKRRQLERQCRRTNLEMHKDMFKVQSKYVVTLIKDKKAEYYQQRIRDADKDTFKIVKTLLKPPDNQQGESIDEIIRVEELRSFFDNKIKKIHATLGTSADRDQDNVVCDSSFDHFEPVTQDTVSMFIKRQQTMFSVSPRHIFDL
ncbi:hypothetical protein CAPTEDRAFT_191983 [Capitella teleta]|uniref:Uncharacterized protein n=1 Tax=Capitella teleta TaxID=283909 RepID=R7VLJ6_CAPTE|nr:hypothetical protein CAPTEDRAFT_191983 [Capitella teleta]|eukprot:ELU18336.1 hypothetical protein CAPTEDRAFT_191983 [Capitella teleta]